MVNGKVYSWEDITINVPGLEEIAITEISYDLSRRRSSFTAAAEPHAAMGPETRRIQ